MTPILFLDIDGVLNDHSFNTEAESNTLKPECVRAFNRVLRTVRPTVIVTSAWRYMVFSEVMTWVGFGHMLRTHGVDRSISALLGGTIRPDTMIDGSPVPDERGIQIAEWLRASDEFWDQRTISKSYRSPPHVVLDDLDLGITAAGLPFVQTNGRVGLTEGDADRVIHILTAGANS